MNPSRNVLFLGVVGTAVAGGLVFLFARNAAAAPFPTAKRPADLPTAKRPADLPTVSNIGAQVLAHGTIVTTPDGSTRTILLETTSTAIALASELGASGGILPGSTWADPLDPTKVDTLLSDGTVSQETITKA